ncbi:outer membrane protein [Sphingomonas sp.]|uniref:outer membrane protein n=1 Tax=Sphingomonas sp. TaxID=28214 RepID=UPI0035C83552
MRFTVPAALAATVATMFVAASPASAQDAAAFEGPRVEASVGLDQLKFDLGNLGGTGRAKASDVGYNVAFGFDRAVSPSLLIGADAGVTLSDIGADGDALRKRRQIELSGRIGTPLTSNTLLYGKVGYANMQVRELNNQRDLDGVLLGAGVEVKVSPAAYLKSEYRYVDYADGYSSNNILTGVGVRF